MRNAARSWVGDGSEPPGPHACWWVNREYPKNIVPFWLGAAAPQLVFMNSRQVEFGAVCDQPGAVRCPP
jgi:hypothetical protein